MNQDDTPEGLSKNYQAEEVEKHWYKHWLEAGLFTTSAKDSLLKGRSKKKPYVVLMPPPNVTGVLHNGHALFITLQDTLVRYNRMLGKNAVWIPGIDHAGIATQAVVEREIAKKENTTRHKLGRDKFLERVWAWKEKNGNRIIEQLKLMGASADWSKTRFTMDDQCSHAVKTAFAKLWEDGLIYRGERLVHWDPVSHTALSNEEVDHITQEGELWRFAYKLKDDPNKEIVVATTRPETMLGDTAVAVHPEDERFQDLIGKELLHPFIPKRNIKVIADEKVEKDFGTGAVKITPAHDLNDFEMGERHGLEKINIFTQDAKVNDICKKYIGLDRFLARQRIKKDLEDLGLARGTEKISHNVSISQRSKAVIEPRLSRQYFIRTKELAKGAYEAVDSGKVNITPGNWKKTWDHFLLNIQDWCISRQLWWGHRIPVFYDVEKLKQIVTEDAKTKGCQTESLRLLQKEVSSRELLQLALNELDDEQVKSFSVVSELDLEEKHGSDKFLQEEDVLDTWFSAGLWPFSTLGWPNNTDDLKAFYPSAVLETGFDILFFWVARMMMFGIHFMKKPPFKDIFLHAMVRDAHGQKMSKSLGNAIDPTDVINGISLNDLLNKTKTYPVPENLLSNVLEGIEKDFPEGIPASGADGLRLSLAILSGQGRDVKLAIPRVAGYRAFLNKVWNATRFVFMRLENVEVIDFKKAQSDLKVVDKWILSRLQKTTERVREALDKFNFSEAAETIYHFFWTEFCDWYIEFAKVDLNQTESGKSKQVTATVLVELLDTSMRLFHPFCPFITEEIWQKLPNRQKRWATKGIDFCAIAPYPEANAKLINDQAEKEVETLQSIITMIRNARQESNLPAQKRLDAVITATTKKQLDWLKKNQEFIQQIGLLNSLEAQLKKAYQAPKFAAINSSADFEVILPLEGLLDIEHEKNRLFKELEKAQKEIKSLEARLNNKSFLAKAPENIVKKHKEQLIKLQKKTISLSKNYDNVK